MSGREGGIGGEEGVGRCEVLESGREERGGKGGGGEGQNRIRVGSAC